MMGQAARWKELEFFEVFIPIPIEGEAEEGESEERDSEGEEGEAEEGESEEDEGEAEVELTRPPRKKRLEDAWELCML